MFLPDFGVSRAAASDPSTSIATLIELKIRLDKSDLDIVGIWQDATNMQLMDRGYQQHVGHHIAANNMVQLFDALQNHVAFSPGLFDLLIPCTRDMSHLTPLHHAAIFGHAEIFAKFWQLSRNYCRTSWSDKTFGETPFALALYSDRGCQLDGVGGHQLRERFDGRMQIAGWLALQACGYDPLVGHLTQSDGVISEIHTICDQEMIGDIIKVAKICERGGYPERGNVRPLEVCQIEEFRKLKLHQVGKPVLKQGDTLANIRRLMACLLDVCLR